MPNLIAELSFGQRLKSGQHSPGGVGGTEPSLQTLKMQDLSLHLLLQSEKSGQHSPSGVGGTEPSSQPLKIQAISPHVLRQNDISGQH